MSAVSRGAQIVGVVLIALSLVACGAPTGSPAQTIGPVPYDLSAPSSSPGPTVPPPPMLGPQVYLVRDEVLVAAKPAPPVADTRGAAVLALEQLVAGPTDQDRTAGLSTALSPEVRMSLVSLSNGRATVDIQTGEPAPGAGQLPLAVGQVVLTLTSIDGVDDVVLTSDGTPISAPLPGGALTDQALQARDYAELTVAPTTPAGLSATLPTT